MSYHIIEKDDHFSVRLEEKTLEISSERLQQIFKAEAEGRLVVLPCKVGDTVYLLLERLRDGVKEIVESRLVQHSITRRVELLSCFIDCAAIGNTLEFGRNEIGKTVFLTREEAETALKGGKENG